MKRAVMLLTVMAIVIVAGVAVSASSSEQAQASPQAAKAPIIETWKLTPESSGNYRHPAVGEDSKGNRLVIFRGPEGTIYYYAYREKGGTWSSPSPIAGGVQPPLVRSLYAYIVVDSTDRFHCYWEDANSGVYATFKDGAWTTPIKPGHAGRYDLTSAIAVRPNDQVDIVDCEAIAFSKDIWVHSKGKNETQFRPGFNLTRDYGEGSTQPHAAADSNNNLWVVWKSDLHIPGVEENLVIYLGMFKPDNTDGDIDWIIVSYNPGWAFLPQVAVNNEDKVMTLFSQSTSGQYMTRLYDPATKTLGPITSLEVGLTLAPWHTFFSRLAAHGKDFYAAAMTGGRELFLLKFDETKNKWDRVARIGDRSVEQFALYSGYDRMLVAWSMWDEPTSVYLTAVEAEPLLPKQYALTIQAGAGGTTNPVPGSYNYDRGSKVTVTAVPDLAFKIAAWSGDVSGTSQSVSVTMDADITVKANFHFVIQPPLNLQVQRRVERGFFNAFYLYLLSWEANLLNSQQGDVVANYRIYRKVRFEGDTKWTRIAEVPPSTLSYMDAKHPKDFDYVYGVTSVHINGEESTFLK